MVNEQLVKQLQNILRIDDGIDGDAQRIRQLTWLLFLKIIDDKERELELFNSQREIIPEGYRWRDWAADDEGITGDKLLKFVNEDLFPTLSALVSSKDEFSKFVGVIFRDNYNFSVKGTVLRRVINKINEIDFNRTEDMHQIGAIYEKILNDLQYAGNDGEIYTPRPVTRFITDMLDPKLGEKILDPACGTGGFLVDSIEHIRKNQVKTAEDEAILKDSINGIEKKPLPHLLCVTNLLLHGIEAPTTINRGNLLARPMRDIGATDKVDIIVANPPFSGSEDTGVESNFPNGFKTKTTGDLFMYAFMRLLKPKGRAGVVMPSSFLSGSGVETNLKEKLINEFNLHTIVILKRGVFYKPVMTVILFFDNTKKTDDIWFYDMPLPKGVKQYNKGNKLKLSEFEPIKEWWNNRTENEHAWKVSAEAVSQKGYDLHLSNPSNKFNDVHDKDELINDLIELTEASNLIVKNIKSVFDDSLPAYDSVPLTKNGGVLNKIGKLRETVLQLAVEGNLTPQKSADEPVIELLERIDKEKTKLVAEKKIKNQKALQPIASDEIPFVIPESWSWVRLADYAQIIGGGTPSTSEEDNFTDEGVPWLTPADLGKWREMYISKGKRDISEKGLRTSSARLLPKDSVLFTSRAPIGHVAIAANEIATNQGFKSLIPYEMRSNKFLYYYLKCSAKKINDSAPGTTFKEVSGARLGMEPLPVPPIQEQERIVEKVEALMSLCDELENKLSAALQPA